MTQSPAFQYYPNDFLSDPNVMVMTAAEVGAYWLLISVCWKQESLPDDVDLLAEISRIPKSKFIKSWESRLKRCFTKLPNGNWTHKRLIKERLKQTEHSEKRRQAGVKGAEQRWQTHGNAITDDSKPDGNAIANDGSSSSISSSSSKKKKTDKPPDSRLAHPALIAVRDLKGKYPNKDTWDLVVDTLGSDFDPVRLRECWLTWRAKNYGPENLGWLVDWYVNGIPERNNNGAHKPNHGFTTANERREASFNGLLSVVQKLRDESSGTTDEDVRRKPVAS